MKEAATEVDLNISAFGKIERGDAKPSKRVAALLSQRYNMPIEELLRPLRP
jgi:transcriptional regulator with XRE-family HTH domain